MKYPPIGEQWACQHLPVSMILIKLDRKNQTIPGKTSGHAVFQTTLTLIQKHIKDKVIAL